MLCRLRHQNLQGRDPVMQRLWGEACPPWQVGVSVVQCYQWPTVQGIVCKGGGCLIDLCSQVPVADDDFAQAEKTGTRLYKIWGTDRSDQLELFSSLA